MSTWNDWRRRDLVDPEVERWLLRNAVQLHREAITTRMRDREWSPDSQQGPQALPGFCTGRTARLHRELERDSDKLVLDLEPRFFVNRRARRASHVLVVPIEEWGRGIWRPVTAFEANAWQVRRYRSSL